MSVSTDKTGQIQRKTPGAPGRSLADLVASPEIVAQISRALPKHVTPDRMARIVLTALRGTPKLAECTPDSFLGCVLQTAQLGLEPNTPLGHAYLIPRTNRKQGITQCTLILGYQGMLELAMRSGRVSSLYAHTVHNGDDFHFAFGLDPMLHHVPSGSADRESERITHAYAVARIKGADPVFVVLSRAQIDARRLRSASGSDGPWATDYESMALKTAVRALWKWLPKSPEMNRVQALEETSYREGRPAFDPAIDSALDGAGLLPPPTIEESPNESSPT